MKWFLVVVFLSPGGDLLMKSYNEYASEKSCLEDLQRVKNSPHPYGLKLQLSCEQLSIQK
jgi:hypothetical protein